MSVFKAIARRARKQAKKDRFRAKMSERALIAPRVCGNCAHRALEPNGDESGRWMDIICRHPETTLRDARIVVPRRGACVNFRMTHKTLLVEP
jgi:hypothetical protein